ncbi:gamma-interferon-responsive lysosomal thiol protein isoform X1 [Hevea brasiliensis]|uniref:gamma-interferon-responsive lysosomal thiol protein isoform X1 n=1 Tax=Hevea brasiliensis TaxID=3981 RepID=UPI0025CFC9A9|nr:gamma-interferon-responsive lysosomal thiol protein isoform X1 [Hevea brasiliensis]
MTCCWKSLVFLFFIPFLLFFLSPSTVASFSSDVKASTSVKVNLSVYYETLCTSCANFIVKNLMSIFNNGLIDIISLRMVPWGNAHINRVDNSMVCQNGLDECELNTIHACAINVWHDVNKYYALIYCIEFLAIEGRHRNWQTCFDSLGLPAKSVLDCYNNGTGTKLEVEHGYETAHLDPPHAFVPWVVVNYQPLGNDYKNFTTYICNAYKGIVIPSVCKLPAAKINSIKEASPVRPVCCRGDAKNLTSLRPIKRKSRKAFQKEVSEGFRG